MLYMLEVSFIQYIYHYLCLFCVEWKNMHAEALVNRSLSCFWGFSFMLQLISVTT